MKHLSQLFIEDCSHIFQKWSWIFIGIEITKFYKNLKMRKLILTLLISLILLQAVTPTLIITHSTPKIFRLTKTKMAIVIDEPEDVAQDHLERVKANEISREQSGPTYQQTPQATPQRVAVDQAESESDTQ